MNTTVSQLATLCSAAGEMVQSEHAAGGVQVLAGALSTSGYAFQVLLLLMLSGHEQALYVRPYICKKQSQRKTCQRTLRAKPSSLPA